MGLVCKVAAPVELGDSEPMLKRGLQSRINPENIVWISFACRIPTVARSGLTRSAQSCPISETQHLLTMPVNLFVHRGVSHTRSIAVIDVYHPHIFPVIFI